MSTRGGSWEEPSAAHALNPPPRMRARKWRLWATAAPVWEGLGTEVVRCAGASTVSRRARGAELHSSPGLAVGRKPSGCEGSLLGGILAIPTRFSVIKDSKSLSESTDLLPGRRRHRLDAVIFLPVDSAQSPHAALLSAVLTGGALVRTLKSQFGVAASDCF